VKCRFIPVCRTNEAGLSANIPKPLKDYLVCHALLLDRSMAKMVRFALDYQSERDWDDIPRAQLTPEIKKRLKAWLDEGADLRSRLALVQDC